MDISNVTIEKLKSISNKDRIDKEWVHKMAMQVRRFFWRAYSKLSHRYVILGFALVLNNLIWFDYIRWFKSNEFEHDLL